jgi:hypothetical protein
MFAKRVILTLLIVAPTCFYGQNYHLGFGLSNNVTAWPIIGYPKLFYSQFHPGFDIILEKKINKKEKNQLWAEANLGTYYHRFFQTAVKLNVNLHYRYFFTPRVFSDIGLGGGYLHSFYQYQIFKINSNGDYVQETGIKGRPQYVMGFCLGLGIGIKKTDPDFLKLLIQFRSNVQGKFAGNFVPIVPNNTFLLGLTHRFNSCKKKNEKNN